MELLYVLGYLILTISYFRYEIMIYGGLLITFFIVSIIYILNKKSKDNL